MVIADAIRYSEEEIEILNLIEELHHFQKLINIAEQEHHSSDDSTHYELQQYYDKRQIIYKKLISGLLNLETNMPLVTSLLFRLIHKSTSIKNSNTNVNGNLLKELESINYLLAS